MQEANTLANLTLNTSSKYKEFFFAINHKKFTGLVNYIKVAVLKRFFVRKETDISPKVSFTHEKNKKKT